MSTVKSRPQSRSCCRRSSIDAELSAVRVHADFKQSTSRQLEGVRQANADMFVLIRFLRIQPLAVVDSDIDHAPVSGTVQVVDHVLPALLGEFWRPLKRKSDVAFARCAGIRSIRTIDGHALAGSLPVVPGCGHTLETGTEAVFLILIEIPFSPRIAHRH